MQVQREPGSHYTVRHNYNSPANVSTTITHALADMTGCDVREAEEQISKYVDMEALDRLFNPLSQHYGYLCINLPGSEVIVNGNGNIQITTYAR